MGTLRKILTTGVGAALMTEGEIRRQAKAYISEKAERGKEEVGRVLAGEVRRLLSETDLRGEIRRLLQEYSIEVEAKIRLVPLSGDRHKRPKTRP